MIFDTIRLTSVVLLVSAGVALAEMDRKTNLRLASTFAKIRAEEAEHNGDAQAQAIESELQTATFGTGCFWCTEAVFEELNGVKQVVSGYSGGRLPNPSYQQVLTGLTGHAEVVHLQYDPQIISYAKLLEVFWRTHDPTTLNRQGPDVGTQYRSVIFYHTQQQRELAERYKSILNRTRTFNAPVVTQITEFDAFYLAKGYHQNYFAQNGRAPYCRSVIQPKMKQFRRIFREELKRNNKSKQTDKVRSQ